MKIFKNVLIIFLLTLIFGISSCEFNFSNNDDNNDSDNVDDTIINAILDEYNALANFKTTVKTTWTFDGTVLDMNATKYNASYNTYDVMLILLVSDVKVGINLGQVDGKYPLNINGLEVGTIVTVTGVIDPFYTVRSGGFYSTVSFTKPEISWPGMNFDSGNDDLGGGNNNDNDDVLNGSNVNFVMINDTHGSFTDSSDGNSIGRVGSLIERLESSGQDYIKIANGDILQGSYVSSKSYGYAMIEALNLMEFDVFVIGNHEFDWGLDKIARYKDGVESNGEANFPFLGANIFYKGTTTSPDWIEPYAIINYGDVKVGVIGVIGAGQESDILKAHVSAYEFASPKSIIDKYAKELRNEKDCDVVVLASHDYDEYNLLYQEIANFDNKIDAIFAAHTHWLVNDYITRKDGINIPILQNKHKNVTIQELSLKLDSNKSMQAFSSKYHYGNQYAISSKFDSLFSKYNDLLVESQEIIGYTQNSLSRQELGVLSSETMLAYNYNVADYSNVSLGIINTGGVRSGFDSGNISVATVFNTFPFENEVLLVKMYGRDIKELINSGYFYTYGLDANSYQSSSVYVIAVVDYAFYANDYLFRNYISLYDTDILMRDILIDYVRAYY